MANPNYVGRHNPDYVFNYDPNEDAWSTDLATLDMSRAERFATTPSGRSSSGCARKRRCITAPTA